MIKDPWRNLLDGLMEEDIIPITVGMQDHSLRLPANKVLEVKDKGEISSNRNEEIDIDDI
jgi:hypothetical protein